MHNPARVPHVFHLIAWPSGNTPNPILLAVKHFRRSSLDCGRRALLRKFKPLFERLKHPRPRLLRYVSLQICHDAYRIEGESAKLFGNVTAINLIFGLDIGCLVSTVDDRRTIFTLEPQVFKPRFSIVVRGRTEESGTRGELCFC